ncbi:hypothetical protein DPMN_175769 [Dreissena polymorpha]|uniref:HAT C-terminal dimerisation domain-containing protein n=1 Tax=Dreissena polymorpha TaxID=45954 RepID=A0A9D4E5S9_DREPO|nr:hypothetical protein DPMN_175769 [Dreissena polymorpha]
MLNLLTDGNVTRANFRKWLMLLGEFLSVPATFVPSEHIFSITGLLINKLRNRLASDLVDASF